MKELEGTAKMGVELGKTAGRAFLEAGQILKESIKLAWQKGAFSLIERRKLYQAILDEYYAGKPQPLPYTTPFFWSRFRGSWGRMLAGIYIRTRI